MALTREAEYRRGNINAQGFANMAWAAFVLHPMQRDLVIDAACFRRHSAFSFDGPVLLHLRHLKQFVYVKLLQKPASSKLFY